MKNPGSNFHGNTSDASGFVGSAPSGPNRQQRWGCGTNQSGAVIRQTTFRRIDVRPILARGEDPYAEIRKRVDALKPDEGLAVTAPFLPSPLIEKLGSEGFKSRVERGAGGGWTAFFWREAP